MLLEEGEQHALHLLHRRAARRLGVLQAHAQLLEGALGGRVAHQHCRQEVLQRRQHALEREGRLLLVGDGLGALAVVEVERLPLDLAQLAFERRPGHGRSVMPSRHVVGRRHPYFLDKAVADGDKAGGEGGAGRTCREAHGGPAAEQRLRDLGMRGSQPGQLGGHGLVELGVLRQLCQRLHRLRVLLQRVEPRDGRLVVERARLARLVVVEEELQRQVLLGRLLARLALLLVRRVLLSSGSGGDLDGEASGVHAQCPGGRLGGLELLGLEEPFGHPDGAQHLQLLEDHLQGSAPVAEAGGLGGTRRERLAELLGPVLGDGCHLLLGLQVPEGVGEDGQPRELLHLQLVARPRVGRLACLERLLALEAWGGAEAALRDELAARPAHLELAAEGAACIALEAFLEALDEGDRGSGGSGARRRRRLA